jgi:rubrerythrin
MVFSGCGYAYGIHKTGGIFMSADFAQSETRLNLMRAFAGESQARNRYTFAAGLARRKNLYVLESVFTFTADQERAHAKVFYNLLEQVSGQNLQVDGTYPVELFPDILDHLRSAQHQHQGHLHGEGQQAPEAILDFALAPPGPHQFQGTLLRTDHGSDKDHDGQDDGEQEWIRKPPVHNLHAAIGKAFEHETTSSVSLSATYTPWQELSKS